MRFKSIFAFLFSLLLMQMTACTKSDAAASPSLPATAASLAGNFTVSSFVSGSDQTSVFSSYRFAFLENGILTATKENTSVSGTWKFDDSDNTELKIQFPDTPLNELNKSWHIAELTDTNLLLTDDDDNGEDSNDDNPASHSRLQFERD